MGARASWFPLLPVLASLLVLSPALAQNDYRLKPGAAGKVCLGCHVTFEETMQLPFVHTPVESGNCADCHDPHASDHGKLLADDVDRICLRCHEGIVPAEAMSVHESALSGNCAACHDPHASNHANNLLRAGNELCYGCHEDVAANVAASRFKHSPVETGCLSCHTPHASEESDSLLRQDEPELCKTCHDPTNSFFVSRHVNYPVAEARCTSCHDPHGSDNSGILWASVHRPVITKMCNQCHHDASSPDALSTKKAGIELCRGCHSSTVNQISNKKRAHWPVMDQRACLNCHSPHATREAALLVQPTKSLCGTCHDDTIRKLEASTSKHDPVEDGNCAACHSPHASDNEFLLEQPSVLELCGSCHDWKTHSSHPIGEKVVDSRNGNLTVDCLSCHRSHGSEFEHMAHYDPRMDLCVQCHSDLEE